MTPLKNEAGNRYGLITVVDRQRPMPGANHSRWVCRCDCGEWTVRTGWDLRRGKVKSCGCYKPVLPGSFKKGHQPWNYGTSRVAKATNKAVIDWNAAQAPLQR